MYPRLSLEWDGTLQRVRERELDDLINNYISS